VPVDDEVLGERMCACVVLRDGAALTLPELIEHLQSYEVARYKLPEFLQVYSEFPLSPIGKVSKKDLVAQLRESHGA
jgi:2,3-dihydroxybenzoate-AMP ligase